MSTGGFGGAVKTPGEVKAAGTSGAGEVSAEGVQRIEALRFDRIKNLFGAVTTIGPIVGQLQGLLAMIDVTKIGALVAAVQEVLSAPDLKAKVLAGLKLARIFVAITPGEADNALLDQLDKFIGNGALLDTLLNVLKNSPGIGSAIASGTVTVQSVEALSVEALAVDADSTAKFEAAGFDLASILTIAKLLVGLFGAFQAIRKNVPAPAPTA